MLKQILIVGLVLMVACKSDLQLPDETPPRLVVWGALYPDSIPKVYVSETFPPLAPVDAKPSTIEKALVLLYENDRLIDTLRLSKPGVYAADRVLPLKVGAAYHVRVSKSGYPLLITAPDTFPTPPEVATVRAELTPTQQGNFAGIVTFAFKNKLSHPYLGTQIRYTSNSVRIRQNWPLLENTTCNTLTSFSVYDYAFAYYGCFESYDKLIIRNLSIDADEAKKQFTLSIAVVSPASGRIFEKIGLFRELNVRSEFGVDPFFEPIYLPIEAEGGYGRVSCFNTSHTTFKF
jgi:Domain of unknown function (DUF4249)